MPFDELTFYKKGTIGFLIFAFAYNVLIKFHAKKYEKKPIVLFYQYRLTIAMYVCMTVEPIKWSPQNCE